MPKELNQTLEQYEAEKRSKKLSNYTPQATPKKEENTVSQELNIAGLTLYQLDHMSADEYRRYINNPDFKKKVDELELLRSQKLAARNGIVVPPPPVPEQPS